MARRKILVVDDDERMRELLAITLRIEGYECTVVDNGHDAVNLVIDEAPELLITDLMMPGMDGYELSRRIREVSAIPIIMITSLDLDEQVKANAATAGASSVMRKPIYRPGLLTEINKLLGD